MQGKNLDQVTETSFTFSLDSIRNKSSQGLPTLVQQKVLAIVFGSLSYPKQASPKTRGPCHKTA